MAGKSEKSGWDEVELGDDAADVLDGATDPGAPIDVDGSMAMVSTDGATSEPVAASDGDGAKPEKSKEAKRSTNFNGLTGAQYTALRKAGNTPAKYAEKVGVVVAKQLGDASTALTDENLATAIAKALGEDASEAGTLTAIWWTNVSPMAKRRVFNVSRGGVSAPAATPAGEAITE